MITKVKKSVTIFVIICFIILVICPFCLILCLIIWNLNSLFVNCCNYCLNRFPARITGVAGKPPAVSSAPSLLQYLIAMQGCYDALSLIQWLAKSNSRPPSAYPARPAIAIVDSDWNGIPIGIFVHTKGECFSYLSFVWLIWFFLLYFTQLGWQSVYHIGNLKRFLFSCSLLWIPRVLYIQFINFGP